VLPLNNWGFDQAHQLDLTYGFIQGTESFSNGLVSYVDIFDGCRTIRSDSIY
jgi:hypothetical protein